MTEDAFAALRKRAFAEGEIDGLLTLCGSADALRRRGAILAEAERSGAGARQKEALLYAFNRGLDAGATAAPLLFRECSTAFFDFINAKNAALADAAPPLGPSGVDSSTP